MSAPDSCYPSAIRTAVPSLGQGATLQYPGQAAASTVVLSVPVIFDATALKLRPRLRQLPDSYSSLCPKEEPALIGVRSGYPYEFSRSYVGYVFSLGAFHGIEEECDTDG